jgi:peptidyl-prolyl cis-trans isomerase C
MKLFKFALVLGLMSLAACHPNTPPAAATSATVDTVATVNGAPISRNMYDVYVKGMLQAAGKDPSTLTQQQKDEALDTLVRAQLVSQQADKIGLTKQPQTADLIELSRMNAVQQAFGENFAKENKPTEEEVKKEYDAQVAQMPHTEYHVEHILVLTQDAASKVIVELGKGAKFEDLAKKTSSDSSKDQGGDLGWQTPERMVKPFSDAMTSLKPGEYTHVPVQTQYGWHVIKLVETRALTPPSFDSVKERVVPIVLGKKYKAYVDGLLAKAQIDKKM